MFIDGDGAQCVEGREPFLLVPLEVEDCQEAPLLALASSKLWSSLQPPWVEFPAARDEESFQPGGFVGAWRS